MVGIPNSPHQGTSPTFVSLMATGLYPAGARVVAHPESLLVDVSVKLKSTTSPTVPLH